MLDDFDDVREAISASRDQINALDLALEGFFKAAPCQRVVEFDRSTGQNLYKFRLSAKLPGKTKTFAKHALEDMRSALGYAVRASTVTLRPGVKVGKTEFPFAPTAMLVHDRINGELRAVHPEIRSLLESFCPHETGNKLLWALNSARNTKAHNTLLPFGLINAGFQMHVGSIRFNGSGQIGDEGWDSAKGEIVYMRADPGSYCDDHSVSISFKVLFGEGSGMLQGVPALTVLNSMLNEVERVAKDIESETERILQQPN